LNAPFHSATPSTPTTSLAPSDAEIIEQLKQQLDATTQQLDVTSQRLQLSELRVQLLEDKLRLQRIAKYGPGSEKLTSPQLELLDLEPGISNLEVAAEGEREALPSTPDKKKRKHPGRQTLPANLPRVERVIVCTAEQCVWRLRAVDNGDRLRRERAVGR
jgi:transposase IS166 family protein